MQNTSALYNTILADDNHWFESQLIIDGVGTFGEDQLFSIETTTEALNDLPQVGVAAAGEINVKMAFPKGDVFRETGSVVTLTATGSPFTGLKTDITPTQSYNGYDRPWPAGGGKNKYSRAYFTANLSTKYVCPYGLQTASSTLKWHGTPVRANTSYRVTIWLPLSNVTYGVYGAYESSSTQITFLSNGSGSKRAFTVTPATDGKIVFWLYTTATSWGNAGLTTIDDVLIQIEEGTTSSDYAPYANVCPIQGKTGANVYVSPTTNVADATVYSASWSSEVGDVYSGSYDMLNGVLKHCPAYQQYNGEALVGRWMSSMDVYAVGTTPTIGAQVVDIDGAVTTIQLAPQQVFSLNGATNVWADTGDVTVEYSDAFDPRTGIPVMAMLKPQVRVCHDSADPDELHSEWLSQGIYFIDTREYTDCPDETVVVFHGYDAMLKAEQYYPDTAHAWPYTDIDVVYEIADIMGISVDSRTYEWMTAAYQIPLPASYTMREVLENIAAAYAGNFVISAEGKILFIPLCGFAEPTDFDYLADENGNALVFGDEGWCILV